MKLSNKKYVYVSIIIILLFTNINLYKNTTVSVGDTVLHKPSFYRLISTPSKKNNSDYELFKHYMGMESYFEFKEGSLVLLQYKHLFLDADVGILVRYQNILSELGMRAIKMNMKNIINEQNCFYEYSIDKNNRHEISGFYKSKNISFSIISHSKEIIFNLKDDICK